MNEIDRACGLRAAALDELVEEITVDAYGEGEQLWAFRQSFEDNVRVPCEGFIIGEPVTVIEFGYDGNERRGLTVKCRRTDGYEHVVAAAEVEMPLHTEGARYLAAYRRWMELPQLPRAATPTRVKTRSKAAAPSVDLNGPVELAIQSVNKWPRVVGSLAANSS